METFIDRGLKGMTQCQMDGYGGLGQKQRWRQETAFLKSGEPTQSLNLGRV